MASGSQATVQALGRVPTISHLFCGSEGNRVFKTPCYALRKCLELSRAWVDILKLRKEVRREHQGSGT